MPMSQSLTRLWKTGRCKFSDVTVNEHAIVRGDLKELKSYLEHYDSPNLEHWLNKQNQYTTSEALIDIENQALSNEPKLFGNKFERRMWLKKNFPEHAVKIFHFSFFTIIFTLELTKLEKLDTFGHGLEYLL